MRKCAHCSRLATPTLDHRLDYNEHSQVLLADERRDGGSARSCDQGDGGGPRAIGKCGVGLDLECGVGSRWVQRQCPGEVGATAPFAVGEIVGLGSDNIRATVVAEHELNTGGIDRIKKLCRRGCGGRD